MSSVIGYSSSAFAQTIFQQTMQNKASQNINKYSYKDTSLQKKSDHDMPKPSPVAVAAPESKTQEALPANSLTAIQPVSAQRKSVLSGYGNTQSAEEKARKKSSMVKMDNMDQIRKNAFDKKRSNGQPVKKTVYTP